MVETETPLPDVFGAGASSDYMVLHGPVTGHFCDVCWDVFNHRHAWPNHYDFSEFMYAIFPLSLSGLFFIKDEELNVDSM